ncbi:MAG: dihydrofolate reductase family protein [Burkholderiaceae bacterium]|jgi:dihydrofolate reductase
MRKIVESTLLALDGVIGMPHVWASAYFGEEAQLDALKRLEGSEALLMGRRTCEIFQSLWSGRRGAYPDRINGMRKYVFSNTLSTMAWANTEIVRGDPVDAVTRMKLEDGPPLMMYGHGPLGQSLLSHGLLDEIRIAVHPLLVGSGARFVQEGESMPLELMETTQFSTGVVVLAYRPFRTLDLGNV